MRRSETAGMRMRFSTFFTVVFLALGLASHAADAQDVALLDLQLLAAPADETPIQALEPGQIVFPVLTVKGVLPKESAVHLVILDGSEEMVRSRTASPTAKDSRVLLRPLRLPLNLLNGQTFLGRAMVEGGGLEGLAIEKEWRLEALAKFEGVVVATPEGGGKAIMPGSTVRLACEGSLGEEVLLSDWLLVSPDGKSYRPGAAWRGAPNWSITLDATARPGTWKATCYRRTRSKAVRAVGDFVVESPIGLGEPHIADEGRYRRRRFEGKRVKVYFFEKAGDAPTLSFPANDSQELAPAVEASSEADARALADLAEQALVVLDNVLPSPAGRAELRVGRLGGMDASGAALEGRAVYALGSGELLVAPPQDLRARGQIVRALFGTVLRGQAGPAATPAAVAWLQEAGGLWLTENVLPDLDEHAAAISEAGNLTQFPLFVEAGVTDHLAARGALLIYLESRFGRAALKGFITEALKEAGAGPAVSHLEAALRKSLEARGSSLDRFFVDYIAEMNYFRSFTPDVRTWEMRGTYDEVKVTAVTALATGESAEYELPPLAASGSRAGGGALGVRFRPGEVSGTLELRSNDSRAFCVAFVSRYDGITPGTGRAGQDFDVLRVDRAGDVLRIPGLGVTRRDVFVLLANPTAGAMKSKIRYDFIPDKEALAPVTLRAYGRYEQAESPRTPRTRFAVDETVGLHVPPPAGQTFTDLKWTVRRPDGESVTPDVDQSGSWKAKFKLVGKYGVSVRGATSGGKIVRADAEFEVVNPDVSGALVVESEGTQVADVKAGAVSNLRFHRPADIESGLQEAVWELEWEGRTYPRQKLYDRITYNVRLTEKQLGAWTVRVWFVFRDRIVYGEVKFAVVP